MAAQVMSNLRDASRSFADRKNGADEWIADNRKRLGDEKFRKF